MNREELINHLNGVIDDLREFDTYSGYQSMIRLLEEDVRLLVEKYNSATFLIETLEIILSGYSMAAINMCAYEAYKKIKDWQSKVNT